MEMKLTTHKDEYEQYVGKEVRIIGRGGFQIGILSKINSQSPDYSLLPSLVPVNLPKTKGKWTEHYWVNEGIPTKIKKGLVEVIQEVPEGYMSEIVRRTNEINNQKKLPFKERIKSAYRTLRGKSIKKSDN